MLFEKEWEEGRKLREYNRGSELLIQSTLYTTIERSQGNPFIILMYV
jgi:hypothetical protein